MKKICCNFILNNHSLNSNLKYHFWHWPYMCGSILFSSEGTVPVLSLMFFCLQCVFSSNGKMNIKPQKLKAKDFGGKWEDFQKILYDI